MATLIGERRLLPRVSTELNGKTLRILGSNNRTVARVDLDWGVAMRPTRRSRPRPLPARLRLTTGKPSSALHGELIRFLEESLDLSAGQHDELETALRAIGASPGAYATRVRVELTHRMRADVAVKRIHRMLLRTLKANEPGVRKALDPEFLHDFRVAVRRTKTCLALVKGIFPPALAERFLDGFSWLGGMTGPARDTDVYLLKLDGYLGLLPDAGRQDLEPLRSLLEEEQRARQHALADHLESPRYRDLIRSWSAFLARRAPGRPSAPNAARPVLDVASRCIEHRFNRVLNRGRSITSLSADAELHRLRIECKKLRYLLEFFESLYDRKVTASLVGSLKRLQGSLGEFNDLRVHRGWLRELARRIATHERTTVDTMVSIGRLEERLEARQGIIREKVAVQFSRFSVKKTRDCFRALVTAGRRA